LDAVSASGSAVEKDYSASVVKPSKSLTTISTSDVQSALSEIQEKERERRENNLIILFT